MRCGKLSLHSINLCYSPNFRFRLQMGQIKEYSLQKYLKKIHLLPAVRK